MPSVGGKTLARDRLDTRVVVVPDADGVRGAGLARAMAALDAAVVLAGADADALGDAGRPSSVPPARVSRCSSTTWRPKSGRAALVEMVNELFPARNP